MFSDNKELNKMNLIIPSYEDYLEIKKAKLTNAKINITYKLSGFHFYVSDNSGHLLLKVKRKLFNLSDKYVIYNPFGKEKGDLAFREGRKNLGFDVYLYKGNSFVIEKKVNNNNIDYVIDNLPIYFKGDALGSNFEIINENSKKLVAKVSYYSRGGKGMTYNIEFKDDKNKLEIILGIICTKLLQINMMN